MSSTKEPSTGLSQSTMNLGRMCMSSSSSSSWRVVVRLHVDIGMICYSQRKQGLFDAEAKCDTIDEGELGQP